MSADELKKLKDSLPYDFGVELQKRTGFARTYCYQVLSGERKNPEIIDAAILLAKEEKEKRELQKSEIENL